MKIHNKINAIRRTLMYRLTKRLGKSKPINKLGIIKVDRILISRPNGRLGNMLLVTPLVQEIITRFPNCKIDLFVKGNVAPLVFQNYQIDRIIKLPGKPFDNLFQYLKIWISLRKYRYDLVINVDQNSSSGRLSSVFARGSMKIFGETVHTTPSNYKDSKHIAKAPVYSFRDYLGIITEDNRVAASLNLKLTSEEIAKGKAALQQLTGNSKKTICLFTYATGTKCYSVRWWQDLYDYLQTKYSDYNIVEVLPAHNESQINFKAPAFYSKNIREIGAFIANTNVFIGADSGIMHLASAAQITVIGLFSNSNMNKYCPYGNNSVGIDTNCDRKEWLSNIDRVVSIALLQTSRRRLTTLKSRIHSN